MLPDYNVDDHRIKPKVLYKNLKMNPIYQLMKQEEKILKEYLDKMILKGKILHRCSWQVMIRRCIEEQFRGSRTAIVLR